MTSVEEVIAALEAVLEKVTEGRRRAAEGAARLGDAYGHLTMAFGESAQPSAAKAKSRMSDAAEQVREADRRTAAALTEISEYIAVVRGFGNGTTAAAPAPVAPYEPAALLRDMPAFPPVAPRQTHGRAIDRDGRIQSVLSGEKTPGADTRDWRYTDGVKMARRLGLVPQKGKPNVAADVELKWALQMRRDGTTRSRITINHPDGPCRGQLSCDKLLPIWLEENAILTVDWRDNAGRMRRKTYVGSPDDD